MRPISDRRDGPQNLGQLDFSLIPPDPRPVSRKIDLSAKHSSQRGDMGFIEPDARRTGNAFKDQGSFPLEFAKWPNEGPLYVGMIKKTQIFQIRGHRLTWAIRHRISSPVILDMPPGHDRLRHRLAAKAAHFALLPVNLDLK
jgi:hypothetical protein